MGCATVCSCPGDARDRVSDTIPMRSRSLQAITAGLLSGASDVVAQTLTASRPLNWRRTLAVAVRTVPAHALHILLDCVQAAALLR